MMACQRGPAPELLTRYGAEIGRVYAARRRDDSAYRFQWPTREGKALHEEAREALRRLTEGHCAYCDGSPIDAMSTEQVDHFRPKGNPRFYELVCQWDNLFLACQACNQAKREQWDERLLKPDAEGYAFERFFMYRADTGELAPNAMASAQDQERAARTIEILDLNRAGACESRRRAAKAAALARKLGELPDEDASYRFLRPLM